MIQLKSTAHPLPFGLPKVIRRERPASFRPSADGTYLTRTRDMCHGSLCLAGSRVLVEPIIKSFDQGYGIKEVLNWYPAAPREGISYLYGLWKGRRTRLRK
jgi:uncharacterized protein (DUF433 family)